MIDLRRKASRLRMSEMCTSIAGMPVPAIASRRAMLVCESPPGLMMMPSHPRSASSPSLSMSAPSWLDWKKVSAAPALAGLGAQQFLEVLERGAAVDLRFPAAEAVEIGAVEDGDFFHGGADAATTK